MIRKESLDLLCTASYGRRHMIMKDVIVISTRQPSGPIMYTVRIYTYSFF